MTRSSNLVTPNSLRILGISIAAAALALPGCGGNDSATGSGGSGATAAGGHAGHTTGSAGGSTGGSTPGTGGSSANGGSGGSGGVDIGASVLMMHNHLSRDGVFPDVAFGAAAAAGLHLDTTFKATVSGDEYAQVLFYDAKGGKDLIITATEENEVSALDAATGAAVWRQTIGKPASKNLFGCGNIDPNGVTGTPTIDYAARVIYLAAALDVGGSPKHQIFAMSLDDGHVLTGWPVDMSSKAMFAGGITFDAAVHGERGATLLVGDTLYVPYGGRSGDCGDYHGWIVSVPTANPQSAKFWATGATGGGIWAVSGPASDGTRVFITTGNTFSTNTWKGGEAIISFLPSLAFDEQHYYAPANWQALDNSDADLGGTSAMLVDVPGSATKLAVGLGKDGHIYIVDRDNLGGIGGERFATQVANGAIINGAAAYSTKTATYVVFRGGGSACPNGSGDLVSVKITASSASTAWCAKENGTGSPIATVSGDQVIVWGVGAEGDNRLHGFDGDSGMPIYNGGGNGDAMGNLNHLITPIVAKGKIYVGGSGTVYRFTP
jgi:hypothetical protein